MKISIDNGDGQGALDFTGAVAGEQPIKIERKLNEPSICTALFSLSGTQYGPIQRNARVVLQADNGTLLFTGYAVSEPELVPAGAGITGPVYLTKMAAVSDDVLLDRQAVPVTGRTVSQSASTAFGLLTTRVDGQRVTVAGNGSTAMIGNFEPDAARSWSENASTLATMARASYRVVNGQVSLADIGTTVHVLDETDGSLNVAALTASRTKMLVNDVTLCGEEEPQAYVTEIFQGDGTTSVFTLTERPFAVRGARRLVLQDRFEGATVSGQFWKVTDSGSYVSTTAAGLTVDGGGRVDGLTNVAALDRVELGGSILIEITGVQVTAASSGFLACLYSGRVEQADLFAGFHVQQSSAGMVLSPTVLGVDLGASTPLDAGRQYTLRVRVHCKDVQRVLASYYGVSDAGPQIFGGELLPGQVDVVLEVQDTTAGNLQKPVVLYDGSVASAPAACTLVALNSLALTCNLRSVSVIQEPLVWVTMTQPAGGTAATQRLGIATEGANAKVTSSGKLTFFPGNVPVNGALVYVSYRVSGRSVARLANATSIAAEGSATIPGTSRLVCSVTVPPARSSADCENAALALLDAASNRAAAWEGSYAGYNLHASGDMWPGDVLAVNATSAGLQADLVVRRVEITCTNAAPELLSYKIGFANDWAELLSLKVSDTIPKEVWLPQTPADAPSVLPALSGLSVTAVSTTQIDINAGQNAPVGGGFEVRRSDWKFGIGTDGDLVLRSPVPNFILVREAPMEQYFVRMYDGATPPNYSRFSSAVFVNVLM